jgi:hypothetical protein
MLEKAVAASPKWLMPRYLLGLAKFSEHKNEEALFHYEFILDLDSIYLDFECVDCFYMGILNLYYITDQTEKIDGVVQKWIVFRSEMTEQEAYKLMVSYSKGKKASKFWLKKFFAIQNNSFEHQIDRIIMTKYLHKRKYKQKEIIDFIHEMIDLEFKNEIESFLSDHSVKRNEHRKNKIIRDFFPDGSIITGYNRTDFYDNLERLLSIYTDYRLIIKKEALQEMFLLTGINRLENVENYLYWTDILQLLVKRTKDGDYAQNWANRTENLDYEDPDQFMTELFELDHDSYKKNYSRFYDQKFCENLYNLFTGSLFTESEEYKLLKAKCITFDDFEKLKIIEKSMERFIIY